MTTAERLAFWLYPSAYILPEQLLAIEPGLDETLAARLLAAPRLAFRLSRRIIRRRDLPTAPLPAESPAFLLARQPAAELLRLARACGALLHHTAIRSVVLKQERAELRALLGSETHEMAIKRAPFLRLPAAPAPPAGGLLAAIERHGLACLAACFQGEPAGLAGRVALKLEPGSGFAAPEPALAGEAGRRLFLRVCTEGDRVWRAYSS